MAYITKDPHYMSRYTDICRVKKIKLMCMIDLCSPYALSRDTSKRRPLNVFVRSSKAVLLGGGMKVIMMSFDVHRNIFRFKTNFNGIIIDIISARLHFNQVHS